MGDYARKTARLSMREHGAYRLLMDEYYSTLNPLPASIEELCRITRALSQEETEAVTKVVTMYFVLQSDGYHNKRADEEIKAWKKQAEFNREVGKLGGRPRKTKPVTEPATEQKPTPEVRSQKLEVRSQTPDTTSKTLVRPDTVDEPVWNDFIKLRRAKKAPLTATALKGIAREADKAGLTLQAAIEMCCSRGWQGFKAEWVREPPTPGQLQNVDYHQGVNADGRIVD